MSLQKEDEDFEKGISGLDETSKMLAESIKRIDEAFKILQTSPLKKRIIVLLIQDMTKLNKREIEAVLDALPNIKKEFLK
jgi:thioredoxin-like negative regulator of GroEL